ncbi:MAG: gluconate kinase, partial [Marmoricola sp.]|nr:gluconate kinase [Marmoricola sp.]
VRKELAHLVPTARTVHGAGEGIYTQAWTRRVYAELLHRAELLLSQGESVVLDASWGAEDLRRGARGVASACSAVLVELRCEVPGSVAEARVASRVLVSAAGTVSDATPDVAAGLRASFEPWPGAHVLDSGRGALACLEDAVRLVRPDDESAARPLPVPGCTD